MSLIHTNAIIDAFHGVLDDDTAREVIDYRKRMGRRYALTERSAKMLAKNLAACPDPTAAAEEMIVRGWQSVKPEWMARISRDAAPRGIMGTAYQLIGEQHGTASDRGNQLALERLSTGPRH